jgi:hypothetical protein
MGLFREFLRYRAKVKADLKLHERADMFRKLTQGGLDYALLEQIARNIDRTIVYDMPGGERLTIYDRNAERTSASLHF